MANGGSAPEDVAATLDAVFAAQTSQGSLDASYALTDMISQHFGWRALEDFGVLAETKKAAADKKSGARRESAMILLGALFERLPPTQRIVEVIFLQPAGYVALALDALADKGAVVRESAQYALDALFTNLRSEALVFGLLHVLTEYLEQKAAKWQGTVAALQLLGKMADKAKVSMGTKEAEKEKDILREAMGRRLAKLIPIVENGMHHLKSEVSGFPL